MSQTNLLHPHEPLQTGSAIGIIGGGQLGRMLAMAAARFSFQTIVLDPDPNCPASKVTNHHVVAAYDNEEGLQTLAERCDCITYEFENIPVSAVALTQQICPVFPTPNALKMSQDRLEEKNQLQSFGIQTAPFVDITTREDLQSGLRKMGGNGILKTRRFGYDGKGQFRLDNPDSATLETIWAEAGNKPLILEGLVPFEREISIIVARDRLGNTACYDPAENVHREGILRTSTLPATISPSMTQHAMELAVTIVDQLSYVGTMGVEFFVCGNDLLVNEIAPRVHNSGHWTEAACAVSQFEQHIRAVAGLPLANPIRHSDCIMENLIGDDVERLPDLLAEDNLHIHLYGKAETRPGRKMGHFTRLL